MDAIQIQNLTKTYPKFKLHAASITLPMGYIMGLIGENGAGKSTLIKTMLDFSYPDAGSITLLGKDSHQEAVCLKEDDFIIGDVFALREYTDTFSVGWHFNQRFEGKGLAYEAATEFLDYLFCDAGARRVYGFVEDDNLRSKRLCKRLGMRYERCMKEFISFVCYPDGTPRYEDTCIYAILNKEWTEQREQKPNSLGLCRVVTDMHEMNEKKQ